MKSQQGQVRDHALSGYAVLWCRDFRLQAIRRRSGQGIPVALVDDSLRQSVVLVCNALAAESGVMPGIPTVQALARCPLLKVERPSEAAELMAGRILLETSLGWVPGIEETGPGILTLDLATQPPAHWYESARQLRERLFATGLETVIGLCHMLQLTVEGQRVIDDLARRHGISADAAGTLLRAVVAGQGSMAQFDHPELGGSGQWMRGGMTMVGDMFNHGLKAKVDAVCMELALLIGEHMSTLAGGGQMQSQGGASQASGVSLFVPAGGGGACRWCCPSTRQTFH
jgi:hypothetical protein